MRTVFGLSSSSCPWNTKLLLDLYDKVEKVHITFLWERLLAQLNKVLI